VAYNSFPNTFHNDKWQLLISNIPGVDDMSELRYYNNYIKSFTIPEYGISEIPSVGPFGFQVRHQVGGMKKNTDLSRLVVEFKVCEDFRNYLYMFKWLRDVRYGDLDDGSYTGLIRNYAIKRMVLSLLNNHKVAIAKIHFTKLLLLNVSSIILNMGNSEEVTFICEFSYEEIEHETIDPTINITVPDTPTAEIPCGLSGIPSTSASMDWS